VGRHRVAGLTRRAGRRSLGRTVQRRANHRIAGHHCPGSHGLGRRRSFGKQGREDREDREGRGRSAHRGLQRRRRRVDPPDRHLEDQGRYYQQTDKSGYDFISQFGTTVPAAYTVTVKMRGLADSLNSGVMIGQPTPGSRQGATIVDLSGKDYVRWGSYDSTSGTYKFIGGTNLGSSQDPAKVAHHCRDGGEIRHDGEMGRQEDRQLRGRQRRPGHLAVGRRVRRPGGDHDMTSSVVTETSVAQPVSPSDERVRAEPVIAGSGRAQETDPRHRPCEGSGSRSPPPLRPGVGSPSRLSRLAAQDRRVVELEDAAVLD